LSDEIARHRSKASARAALEYIKKDSVSVL